MVKRSAGKDENILTLCGEKGCCPVADFSTDGKVLIKDDINGRVKITWEQLEDLMERAPAIIRRLRSSKKKAKR